MKNKKYSRRIPVGDSIDVFAHSDTLLPYYGAN